MLLALVGNTGLSSVANILEHTVQVNLLQETSMCWKPMRKEKELTSTIGIASKHNSDAHEPRGRFALAPQNGIFAITEKKYICLPGIHRW